MPKKRPRKLRVDFRTNRQVRRRPGDLTRRYASDTDKVEDIERSESVRAKGELSRKRTILVDEHDVPVVAESEWRPGIIVKVHGRVAYVRDDAGLTWECTVRRILRTRLIASRAPVTVGDRVWFSDQSRSHDGRRVGVVERVAPRTSALARRDRRQRAHTIVANADRLLVAASVAEPRLRPHLVDRYIVAALKGGLTPVLCFNKADLLHEADVVEEEDYDLHAAEAREAARAAEAARLAEAARAAETHGHPEPNHAAPAGMQTEPADADFDDEPWDPDADYDPDQAPPDTAPGFRPRQMPVLEVIDEFRRLGYT
ncbi:MAG: GTPase RsgA, partial [Planctomycetota bacterium]